MSLMALLGALGLFLLGMWLMTEGLKLAGGRALERLLGRWTSSRLRGFVAGILVTTLVQSSSAVTIATIGFVNAGLMTFQRSVWVIFGSNVGTTFTAWLVTLFGFSIKIDVISFPLIGLGALLRVFSPRERGRALGMALAGFGIFFMGIDALRDNFSDLAEGMEMMTLSGGFGQVISGLILGILLTVLTQSSSAALALILTSVASGLAGIETAAAAVIGANIGTTSTAVLATIGATANAKRLASAHVAFNVIAGTTALVMLPFFLSLARWVSDGIGLDNNALLLLSIFHTSFNLAGALLMWPLEPRLSRLLLRRFEPKSQAGLSQVLDQNVASVPNLAILALREQLVRIADRLRNQDLRVYLEPDYAEPGLKQQEALILEVENFIAQATQGPLSEVQAAQFTAGLTVSHYLGNGLQSLRQIVQQAPELQAHRLEGLIALKNWLADLSRFTAGLEDFDVQGRQQRWSQLLDQYQQIKRQLLAAAVGSGLSLSRVDAGLQVASLARRYGEQLLQAFAALETLPTALARESG